MSDEERKRIIDEALHGAKVGVEDRPSAPGRAPAPAVTPCCDHCIHKMAIAPTIQPTSLLPYVPYSTPPYVAPYNPSQQLGYGRQINWGLTAGTATVSSISPNIQSY